MTSRMFVCFSDHVVRTEVSTLLAASRGSLSIEMCIEMCDATFQLSYVPTEVQADRMCNKECTS